MKRIHAFTMAGALFLYAIAGACGNSKAPDIRPPAVAGQFYPSDPEKLRSAVEQFLKDSPELPMGKPIALLAPHAGYIYSGQICADAYRQVMGRSYDVVVILGTNHTMGNFSGVSLGSYDFFRTPLGDVPVDKAVVSALLAESKDCNQIRAVHTEEHSIEVQIPFVQVLFPQAKIVPAVIYPPDYRMCVRFGEALAKVLKGRNALIVISSDLSHYPDQRDASRVDRQTLETIVSMDSGRVASVMRLLDVPKLATRACGEAGILAGMTAAKALGATGAVVAGYANSGETPTGESSRAVGYGAVVFVSGDAPGSARAFDRPVPPAAATPLKDPEKRVLLALARESIRRYLTTQTLPLPRNLPARMSFPQGAFVTLTEGGELRGCIGHMSGDTPLGQTVAAMAKAAAFNDPRFMPLAPGELNKLEIEISVLTPMKPVASAHDIVVGRDGVLMARAGASAVFLPQVAVENKWNRSGLQSGCWKRDAQFQVFQAEVFSEHQFK
jgi:AmmeMemoRadiSam system protein B/AmmeMemoRadiSam system protein A